MSDRGSRPTDPAPAGATADGLAPGTVFAGFTIESEIGRGGMGVIYRVRDPELDRTRALKLLPLERSRDEAFRQRFRRESKQAAAIEHPNVTQVFRAGEEGGRLYLLMRYVDGPSLAEVLGERGRLALDETLAIVRQVAAGLDAAHATGLVHRDVKPANVLLEGEPAERRAFLCDFGISKMAEAGTQLTDTGQFVGTVDYVAPELLEGDPFDGRADVYSLACVVFHMLIGEPPFPRATQLATMFAHANAPRPEAVATGVPPAVAKVLGRAMAVDPEHRHPTAGALAAELDRVTGGASVAPTEGLRRPSWRSRRRVPALGLGLAALAAAGVAAVLLLAGDESGPSGEGVETRSFSVPDGPLRIVVGPGRVWVTSPPAKAITSISLDDPTPLGQPLGEAPAGVAVGYGSVWLADRSRNELLRLDPGSGELLGQISVAADPVAVTVAHGDVWVASAGDDEVARVDPGDEQVIARIPVGRRPTALAADDRGLWVANRDGPSISFIDAGVSRVSGKPIDAGQRPNDLAVGAGFVWVTDTFSGTVSRIDVRRKEVVGEPIDVGALPRGVAFGLGYVWVANGEDSTVSRIDPATATVVGEPIRVGDQPAEIATGEDSVWTADFGGSTVTELVPEDSP